MALDYNCTICNRAIGYEGLCWKCKAEKERNEALSLTEAQIQERQTYLIEHLQELGKRKNPADKYFWDCLSYHGIISEDLQRAAVKEKIFYPAEIYYQAPEDVRDELIKSLMSADNSREACFPYADLTENEENYMLDENYEQLANNGLELSEKERPLFYGADDWEAVTLGGFAHWIQDCTITKCPDCGKPMRYLAQLSWESIMNDSSEGTLYVEICPDCKVASMHHQQT